MGAIALFGWCIVSSHLDVSRKEADFSSHLQLVLSSVGLYSSEVHILERSIDCNWAAADSSDNSSFGLIMIEAGWCDNDFLSHCPINWILDSKSGVSSCNSSTEHSPSVLSDFTVDGDEALKTSNALISEHWLLRSIVVTIQHKGKFVHVGFGFCTGNKFTAHYSNESSRNSDVWLISKCECSILYEDSFEFGSWLVNE